MIFFVTAPIASKSVPYRAAALTSDGACHVDKPFYIGNFGESQNSRKAHSIKSRCTSIRNAQVFFAYIYLAYLEPNHSRHEPSSPISTWQVTQRRVPPRHRYQQPQCTPSLHPRNPWDAQACNKIQWKKAQKGNRKVSEAQKEKSKLHACNEVMFIIP